MASFLKHLRTVSGLTLISRLAGLARDAVLGHCLGLTMDAYSVAFRMPNLLRQLLGEGALSAAFIPVFTDYLEKGGPKAASRLMSVVIVAMVTALAALTVTVCGVLGLLGYLTEASSKWHLIFGLAAVLFPFGTMACLVALLQAALNCRHRFAAPALAPVVLNLCIIAGAGLAAWLFSADRLGADADATAVTTPRVYFIAGAILVAGIIEILIQVPSMRRVDLVFQFVWDLRDGGLRRIMALMGPVVIAVGVVQINVFMDSIIAGALSPNVLVAALAPETFRLGPWDVHYPMKVGAAAVLYYGPLIYQFPLGVFAIALATVVFPELSRYAVRKDLSGLARTASHALRLALFIGVPAGVGIMLLCEPLIRLVFDHGRFREVPNAVERVVWVANIFSLGIWSYSINHILNRTFYAMEQITTPRRVAVAAAALNFVCNLILVWPMAEGGLALATVISALFQTITLAWLLNRRCAHLEWRSIAASAARTLAAAAVMGVATWVAVAHLAPMLPIEGRSLWAVQLFGGMAVGAGLFFVAARLMKMTELRDLVGRAAAQPADPLDPDPPAR